MKTFWLLWCVLLYLIGNCVIFLAFIDSGVAPSSPGAPTAPSPTAQGCHYLGATYAPGAEWAALNDECVTCRCQVGPRGGGAYWIGSFRWECPSRKYIRVCKFIGMLGVLLMLIVMILSYARPIP